jgi:uncharacterized membrane protein HdeD (DUF308 family)
MVIVTPLFVGVVLFINWGVAMEVVYIVLGVFAVIGILFLVGAFVIRKTFKNFSLDDLDI